jgi:hypothetical protein
MSLFPIPYQPLPVDVEENCTLLCSGWVQTIERGDRSQVQFNVSPCGSAKNVLTNGTFVEGGDDWNAVGVVDFSDNKACVSVGPSGLISQTIDDVSGFTYQLLFDAEVFNGGIIVYTNVGFTGLVVQSGEAVFTFSSTGITEINLFVTTDSAACIRNVRLMPINTRYRAELQELDGTTVATLPATAFSVARNFLTITANWETLAPPTGCYQLAIFDPCDCSQFGFIGDELELQRQWFITDNSTGTGAVTGGVMAGISVMGAAETIFRMNNVICPNVAYTFTYTLTGMAAGDEFRLFAGIANGVLRTADGTYTEVLTSTHSGDLTSDLRARFTLVGAGTFSMTNFSMEAVTPRPTFITVPFELVEDSCTVLVNACGNIDQFNMGFAEINAAGNISGKTGFSPRIRLEGTKRGNGYDGTREGYEFSTGRRIPTHLRNRKRFDLGFGAPEYVHDFMALLRGFDNAYVDGEAVYFEDDEYPSTSQQKDVDYSTVTLTYSKRTELTENVRTTSLGTGGCSDRGTNLLTNRAGRPTNLNVQGVNTRLQIG